MRNIRLELGVLSITLLTLGVFAGCSDGGVSGGAGMRQSTQTLYAKYGGAKTVNKIINDAAANILADCTQNPYFTTVVNFDNNNVDGQGHGSNGHVTQDRLLSCLSAQLTAAFGGPSTYTGTSQATVTSITNPSQKYTCQDMTTVHTGLGITPEVFDQFVVDVSAAMKKNGVSDADATSVGRLLTAQKSEIVAPEGQQQMYNYQPGDPANPPGVACSVIPSPLPSGSPSASPSPMPSPSPSAHASPSPSPTMSMLM